MKLACSNTGTRRPELAFTLTELLVSTAILVLVMASLVSSHLFGWRLFQITAAKLGASDEARQAISLLVGEVRSAKIIRIGQGSLNSFSEVAVNTPQIGSAIEINPTTSTNTFVRYFWDSVDRRLKRTTNGSTAALVIASSVTNDLVFTSEDHLGVILTNNQNNRVIGLTLQFHQLHYPRVTFGPGQLSDFYQLRTKITRRTLE